jgi:hypothetical protein
MKLIATIFAALALTGCATDDYQHYAQAQMAMAQAKSTADQARYNALARIADSGDSVARVAAVMSLAGLGDGARQAPSSVAAPVSPGSTALQWASILVPGVTQAYMISSNVKLGMRQSDNQTALGLGQSRDQAATSAATFGAITTISSQIQAPAANVTTTLSGTGVLGSGSYSIGPNSGTNSGNSGRLAGTSITDNTHTPAIVTQPAPVVVRPEVVTQPVPAIVRPEVVRPEIVRPEVLPPTPTP